jgi:hypothetical protein
MAEDVATESVNVHAKQREVRCSEEACAAQRAGVAGLEPSCPVDSGACQVLVDLDYSLNHRPSGEFVHRDVQESMSFNGPWGKVQNIQTPNHDQSGYRDGLKGLSLLVVYFTWNWHALQHLARSITSMRVVDRNLVGRLCQPSCEWKSGSCTRPHVFLQGCGPHPPY